MIYYSAVDGEERHEPDNSCFWLRDWMRAGVLQHGRLMPTGTLEEHVLLKWMSAHDNDPAVRAQPREEVWADVLL